MYDSPKTDEGRELTREIIDLRRGQAELMDSMADSMENSGVIPLTVTHMREMARLNRMMADAREERLK